VSTILLIFSIFKMEGGCMSVTIYILKCKDSKYYISKTKHALPYAHVLDPRAQKQMDLALSSHPLAQDPEMYGHHPIYR
jgi:hypothetical protein